MSSLHYTPLKYQQWTYVFWNQNMSVFECDEACTVCLFEKDLRSFHFPKTQAQSSSPLARCEEACSDRKFGDGCNSLCSPCFHGNCHHVTGKCICQPGFQGERWAVSLCSECSFASPATQIHHHIISQIVNSIILSIATQEGVSFRAWPVFDSCWIYALGWRTSSAWYHLSPWTGILFGLGCGLFGVYDHLT